MMKELKNRPSVGSSEGSVVQFNVHPFQPTQAYYPAPSLAMPMNMMSAAVRAFRAAANVPAVPSCHSHRRLLSAIGYASGATCSGSKTTRGTVSSRQHFARRSSSTAKPLADDDILYLPMPKLSPSMVRIMVSYQSSRKPEPMAALACVQQALHLRVLSTTRLLEHVSEGRGKVHFTTPG